MRAKLKIWAGNLALTLTSIAFTLLVFEYVVFGMVLKPDDVLPNVSINGVVRYLPGTNAVFRHPDRTETVVRVNREGWNSTKPDYAVAKTPGRLRVAVVGDSYVHGAFVNAEQGFPEIVERQLQAAGVDAEVFRFGMDGAPLSQYLHMLRREVLRFQPDLVIVQLIHNDFDETYRFLKTRYASSFMKLATDEKGEVVEIAPAEFKGGATDALRNSATFRYLYYKTNLYLAAKSIISRVWWGGDEDWKPEFISSAVDIRKIQDHDKNRFFTRYVMSQMQALSHKHAFKLAFAMDGVREAVYAGKPATAYEVGKLNVLAADVARELKVPFLDLQTAFTQDFAAARQRFEFPFDWHWNVRGNAVAGAAISKFVLADPGLLGQVPARPKSAALDRQR